jgi:hypothetical protein
MLPAYCLIHPLPDMEVLLTYMPALEEVLRITRSRIPMWPHSLHEEILGLE